MLRKWLRRMRIQTVLVLTFFLLSLMLLGTLGAVTYRAAADEIANGAGQEALATLQDAGKRLGLRLDVIEDTALSVSLNPRLDSILAAKGDPYQEATAFRDTRDMLSPYMRYPEVAGLYLIVRDWSSAPLVASSSGIISEAGLRDVAWYQGAEQFDSGWLSLHLNTLSVNSPDRTVVTYVRKIYSTFNAELLGTVAVDVRLEAFQSLLLSGAEPGPIFIAGPQGEFLHPVGGPVVDDKLQALVRTQLADRESSHTQIKWQGRPALLLATEPIHSGMRLVQVVPVDAITTGLTRLQTAFIWGGVGCAVASLLLAWALAAYLGRPISRLVQAMQQVGAGRLDVQVPVGRIGEFVDLEQGFNQMVTQLEQGLADLKETGRRKRRAELEALQAQINPHFLYNTLDMINWMAIGEKQEQISQVVTLLGRFFRLGLSKGETMVPLRQELEHLRIYVQLQQLRFRSSFTVAESFPPELLTHKVPKIVMQPFVENALRHAFADRGGAGEIRLAAHAADGALVLTVADDGAGMDLSEVGESSRVGSGYGIRNVHERIQLLFGSEYGVQIASEPSQGTTVTITLPLIPQEEGKTNVVSHAG